jgi:predicted carbohydrate-binding protein with CBM5 and CBM33 domain
MRASTVFSITLFAATALAHGNITSPPARQPGPAMAAACGQAAVTSVLADGVGPLGTISAGKSYTYDH